MYRVTNGEAETENTVTETKVLVEREWKGQNKKSSEGQGDDSVYERTRQTIQVWSPEPTEKAVVVHTHIEKEMKKISTKGTTRKWKRANVS